MKSYLQTVVYSVEALGGEKLTLRALNAAGQAEIMDAEARGAGNTERAALAVKYGVLEWRDEPLEAILENLDLDALLEIAHAVADLSGVSADPKASKRDQAAA